MSQQVTKEKYSIETLRERNVSYDHQHWLTQEDVDMANSYVELIERTRSKITPQIGDRLVYVTEHGDYYGNALIDSRSAKEGYLSVCEQPYVPFVWEEDGNIRLSVSGGAFHSVNPEELKFLKWTEGVFKDWGHCGACANGSVSFLAKVLLWFYAEPNPRYGDFTTETYRKFYLHKREESENGNLYQGFDIAFRDEAEFRQFPEMEEDGRLKEYLDRCAFINKDGETCEFTTLQKHDLNLVLQKRHALLNWQQGSGKTAAVYHRAKYLLKFRKVRNVIILAPAIATNMTWIPFLSINREQFRVARNNADLEAVPEGVFIVLSTSMLGKLKRGMARFVKRSSRKLCLVFDESDEITNPSSQRTRHILGLFRRLKYKILDTGTTTRNNIAELYSQFELLYNNSINMVCWSSRVYHENRDKEIEEDNNPHYGEPFPAFRGHVLFRACHCPGKSTVFGIEKQNQDVYNKEELAGLIGKTVITRKFRDFAGEKYKIRTHTVARPTASVRFTVSSSRSSAASANCITTARGMQRRMPDSGLCARSSCSSRPAPSHT